MPGEIDISKLSGFLQAFARAADVNGDGKIDESESGIFDGFVNGAEDNALADSFVLAQNTTQPGNIDLTDAQRAKIEKNIDKRYQDKFGDRAIEVQESEGSAEASVLKFYNGCIGRIQDEQKIELMVVISERPKMNRYNDADSYIKALDDWSQKVFDKIGEFDSPEEFSEELYADKRFEDVQLVKVERDGVEYYCAETQDENGNKMKSFYDSEGNLKIKEFYGPEGNMFEIEEY